MNRILKTSGCAGRAKSGFTLIEMLVSVALVMLMMTMFTAIFQMATNSVSKQRVIAENDQRVRMLTTTIRSDFSKLSLRYAMPYRPLENPDLTPTSFGERPGYLYVSTNNPNSYQDDHLQFTVDARRIDRDVDDSPYFGAAALLYDALADPSRLDQQRRTDLRFDVNQPESDDGSLQPNGAGASHGAEISLFLRNGALIRQVMLLREPLAVVGNNPQPESNVQGNSFFSDLSTSPPIGGFRYVETPQGINTLDPSNANHFFLDVGEVAPPSWNLRPIDGLPWSNDFWWHFDYSAVPVFNPPLFNGANGIGNVQFVELLALANDGTAATANLGNPRFRYGFNPLTGLSREHDNTTDLRFIGRFTRGELSTDEFNWPLGLSNAISTVSGNPINNPFALNNPVALNLNTGVVAEYSGTTGRGGPRRVEDVLLNNVHEMKVELWDERTQRYVAPGYGDSTPGNTPAALVGDFHILRRRNASYGPLAPVNLTNAGNVFDTWHPFAQIDADSNGVAEVDAEPPYIPYLYYPPRQNNFPPGPCPPTMPDPQAEIDPRYGVPKNMGYWQPSDFSDSNAANWTYQNYDVGDVVFAPVEFDTNDTAQWGVGQRFEWSEELTIPPQDFQIAYRCVQAGYSGDYGPGFDNPQFPRKPSQRFSESAGNGTVIWESIDNRRPLKSIRLTIRFIDPGSEQSRQLSLILPVTQ